jgi:hypothetical protein
LDRFPLGLVSLYRRMKVWRHLFDRLKLALVNFVVHLVSRAEGADQINRDLVQGAFQFGPRFLGVLRFFVSNSEQAMPIRTNQFQNPNQ